jgi:PilZ domain/Flagellar protein YcgR
MAESASMAELRSPLPIAIQRERDAEQRLRGQLLGQVSPELMLLLGSDDALLEKGERIVVRTLQAGKALGFQTTVQEVLEQPVRLYFVAMPAALEVIKLRKTERLDLLVPADLRYATGSSSEGDTLLLKGNMVDVSGGGCRVVTKRAIPAATVVNVSFVLPGERNACVVSGSVIDSTGQGGVFTQRVKFFAAEKNVEVLGIIRRWVQQNLSIADVT